jgi:hypothetical protein
VQVQTVLSDQEEVPAQYRGRESQIFLALEVSSFCDQRKAVERHAPHRYHKRQVRKNTFGIQYSHLTPSHSKMTNC